MQKIITNEAGMKQSKIHVIGISARKGGGKDTAAANILSRLIPNHSCKTIRFAGGLKTVMRKCFGITEFTSQESKDVAMDNGKSVREVLQYIGTDVMRSIDPNCWVNWWESEVLACWREHFLIVVPDVRFPNEVKAIQDMGGKVIRLTRCPRPEDEHESETALDAMTDYTIAGDGKDWPLCKFNAVLDNSSMTIPEQNVAVWDIVKGWI